MKDKVWEKGSYLCLLNMPTKVMFAEELQGSKPELGSAKVHSCSSSTEEGVRSPARAGLAVCTKWDTFLCWTCTFGNVPPQKTPGAQPCRPYSGKKFLAAQQHADSWAKFCRSSSCSIKGHLQLPSRYHVVE